MLTIIVTIFWLFNILWAKMIIMLRFYCFRIIVLVQKAELGLIESLFLCHSLSQCLYELQESKSESKSKSNTN